MTDYFNYRNSERCVSFFQNPDQCFPLKISLLLNTTQDMDTLLSRVMHIASSILDVEASSLILFDDKRNILTFRISLGPKGEQLFNIELPTNKGIVGQVVQTNKPLIVNDVEKSPYFNPEIDHKTGFKTQSILCVPILYQNQIRGAIEVINKHDGHGFSDPDVVILESIAAQVAVALENVQLFSRLVHEAQQKNRLYLLGKQISSTLDQQEIVTISFQTMRELIGYDYALLSTITPSGSICEMVLEVGIPLANRSEMNQTIESVIQDGVFIDTGLLISYPESSQIMVPLIQNNLLGGFILLQKKSVPGYNDEDLSLVFNIASQLSTVMDRAIYHQKMLEQERVNKTIQIGRQVQASLLPFEYPNDDRFEIFASYDPCLQISGDYYDYFPLQGNRYFILIADAAGKGASAAMMMSAVRSAIHIMKDSFDDFVKMIARVNHLIVQDNREGFFITGFFAIVDFNTREIEYLNCGHNYPFLIREDDFFIFKDSFFPLGISDLVEYKSKKIPFFSGDWLFCYTDGVIEAANEQRELFGESRLQAFLKSKKTVPLDQLHQELMDDIRDFSGNAQQSDDITFLSVRIL